MPRGKGRKSGGGQDSCLMPFHYCFSGALIAGVVVVAGTPLSMSPRAQIEADTWAHFRIKRLAFRMHPTSPITVPHAAGWVGGIQDTPPTTFNTISELIPSVIKGVGQSCPTAWVVIPKSDLAGPFPWYKSVAGAADPTEESPGAIYLAGTGTEAYNLEVRGVFEFKTAVSTSNTPMARQLRDAVRRERLEAARLAERAVLLRILSTETGKQIVP